MEARSVSTYYSSSSSTVSPGCWCAVERDRPVASGLYVLQLCKCWKEVRIFVIVLIIRMLVDGLGHQLVRWINRGLKVKAQTLSEQHQGSHLYYLPTRLVHRIDKASSCLLDL